MKVKDLIKHLQRFSPEMQEEEIVYRQRGGKLEKIDYSVRETDGSRIVLAEEWF